MIVDEKGYIKYLSETYEGSVHDNDIVKQEEWEFQDDTILYQDKGFQGHNPENITIMQPMKKPKNKELTDEQKMQNRKISARRIFIEHIICSVKIFRIVKDTIRNWKDKFKDEIMEICCGLHNYKLSLTKINT